MQNRNDTCRVRGFTMIECAAGIAVLGAIGVTWGPIGGHIKANNFDTQSQMVHHRLARHQMMYIADNNGAFTGANTSGLEWNRELLNGAGDPSQYSLEFDTAGGNPTAVGDWISPLVGERLGFSSNRAMRRAQMLDQVADPTSTGRVDELFVSGQVDDFTQFAKLQQKSAYRQQSFLQMRSFTHFSSEHRAGEPVFLENGDLVFQRYAVQGINDVALSPEGYTPRIWNVGTQAANKVMFADGTRFFTDESGISMSVTPHEGSFPEDSSSGPILHSSVAYGRASGGAPSQGNLDLSFRKVSGDGLYATMFDGSLRYFSREDAWTDPTPWYPSGSSWQSTGASPESQEWVDQNLADGLIP